MEYPCDCSAMKWMIDHNDVFRKEESHWIMAWMELDKTKKGTNIERFGVKFDYCIFCGKKIEG
jgi:hypothetical protein